MYTMYVFGVRKIVNREKLVKEAKNSQKRSNIKGHRVGSDPPVCRGLGGALSVDTSRLILPPLVDELALLGGRDGYGVP